MRLTWRNRAARSVDPNRPHEFRSRSDGGIAALKPIGGGVGRQIADIASAGAYSRTIGCAVPGCGKTREDLIHAPEEQVTHMWPFRRPAKRPRIDPHQHHPFVEPDDFGMAAVASGALGGKGGGVHKVLGVTSAYQRPSPCAVPGCGKDRHDAIHTPADD